MKLVSFIFILFLSASLWSQSGDTLRYNKFDIGFSYSPDYSYRKLKTDASNTWMTSIYDTMEVAKFGYTAGFNFIFHVNENLWIGSGLLLSDKGERTKPYSIQPVNNYINHFYYLDIPIKANYYLHHKKYFYSKEKKLKFFLSAGTSINIHLSTQTKAESVAAGETETIKSMPEISKINLAFLAGFGIDCPITHHWYFKLEPNYRRSITAIADTPIKKYFYSLGLNLGLFCKF